MFFSCYICKGWSWVSEYLKHYDCCWQCGSGRGPKIPGFAHLWLIYQVTPLPILLREYSRTSLVSCQSIGRSVGCLVPSCLLRTSSGSPLNVSSKHLGPCVAFCICSVSLSEQDVDCGASYIVLTRFDRSLYTILPVWLSCWYGWRRFVKYYIILVPAYQAARET